MKIDPNGQAFPSERGRVPEVVGTNDQEGNGHAHGLTIRAYFAGLAMQGIIARGVDDREEAAMRKDGRSYEMLVAGMSLLHAEALIAALNREPARAD